MEWKEASDGYRRFLITTGHLAGTAKTYTSNLSVFWRWCWQHECLATEADKLVVRSYVADRRAAVSAARAHNDLAALKLFFAWLHELRLREDDPTEGIRIKRPKRLATEPLSGEELRMLLLSCKQERDRLIILVLAHTGLRISELASLTCEDFNWRTGEIRLIGKGDKERRIAPNPEVMGRLRAYLGMFATGPIWLSLIQQQPLSAHQLRKIIYEVADRAQVENVHPHRFRAYFATHYIHQFADIQALQDVMGHESIETTARYSQSTKEARALKQMKQFTIE